MSEDQRLTRGHFPDDRRDRVPVEPMEAAHTFMAVHDDIPRVGGDDDDRQLLPDFGQRRQEPALASGLPHTERVVTPIQLVKFELHRHSSVAPTVWTPSPARQQLRTRPPTDDAALRRHPMDPDPRHRGESGEATGARGTLIHHAAARAIRPLPVAMVETPFGTLLVTPAGRPDTGVPGGVATAW